MISILSGEKHELFQTILTPPKKYGGTNLQCPGDSSRDLFGMVKT